MGLKKEGEGSFTSKLVFNLDGGKTDQYGTFLLKQRLFTGEVAEGAAVVANASPSMGVRVQAGTFRIPRGTAPANYWTECAIDTASPGEAVTIATANGSNPRIDYIVAYIDTAVTASTSFTNNSNNVLKLAAVVGTAASSPVVPNSGQITTAIGASNPYIILASILVGTAVTQITNTDITDLRALMKQSFSVYRNGAWTASSGTFGLVTFDSITEDAGSHYDASNGRFTARVAGTYQINAVVFSGVTNGALAQIAIYKNGSLFQYGEGSYSSSSNVQSRTISWPVPCAIGDYIQIYYYGSGGGGGVGAGSTAFSGYLT